MKSDRFLVDLRPAARVLSKWNFFTAHDSIIHTTDSTTYSIPQRPNIVLETLQFLGAIAIGFVFGKIF